MPSACCVIPMWSSPVGPTLPSAGPDAGPLADGGGSGLLLDEELAQAVRNESADAVMAWWGVTCGLVWGWRKLLGVTWHEQPRTHRLTRVAAHKGAATQQTREWTEEDREQAAR